MLSKFTSNRNNSLSEEQLNEIIAAIISGKYSWACLLLLRFCGYNPLDYIPYRTFNRLIKEHSYANSNELYDSMNSSKLDQNSVAKDLSYLNDLDHQNQRIFGGSFFTSEYSNLV
ncbi:MAG: HetP family heterocyst commitment protein [Nodosilinea sp. LVE1205-7]|jgi:hypothetical protein